jgi:hypothetical protein
LGTPLKYGYKIGKNKYLGNTGNVPPRSVEVMIENIPSRCAISVKLGTQMTIRLGYIDTRATSGK